MVSWFHDSHDSHVWFPRSMNVNSIICVHSQCTSCFVLYITAWLNSSKEQTQFADHVCVQNHNKHMLHVDEPILYRYKNLKFCLSLYKTQKEEIWLSPMTKAPTPTEMSNGQSDNTKNGQSDKTKTPPKVRLHRRYARYCGPFCVKVSGYYFAPSFCDT